MKKLLAILVISYLTVVSVNAQSWLWTREGTTPNMYSYGEPTGNHCVANDRKGNVYLTGRFSDSLFFGPDTLMSPLYQSVYLAKYDTMGNVKWARQAVVDSVPGTCAGIAVTTDAAGNVYVTGGMLGKESFGPFSFSNGLDVTFVAKYDPNGNILWAKQSTTTNIFSAQPSDCVTDNAGNLYVTGGFSGNAIFGPYTLYSYSSSAFIVKYDTGGNVIWARQTVTSKYDTTTSFCGSQSIGIDRDNHIYICGNFRDTVNFDSITLSCLGYWGNIYLAKYDSGGNVIWAVQPNISKYVGGGEVMSLAVDGDGNPYIAGYFTDSISFGTHVIRCGHNYASAFLAKYDTSGNALWAVQGKDISPRIRNWVDGSLTADTLKRGGVYMQILTLDTFSSPYNVVFQLDTFNLKTKYQNATLIMHFDSAGNVLCGSLFTEGNEDDGDAISIGRSGKHIYFYGDQYDTSILGSDTLIANGESPFIARWQPCPDFLKIFAVTRGALCNGTCTGTATAVVYGTTAPYKYKWSTGDTTSSISGLCPGTYTLFATDASGGKDSTLVIVTQPPTLTVTTSSETVTCYGKSDGIAYSQPSGGTMPYYYSWSNSKMTKSLTGLSAGTYTVTVSDADGCTATDSINVPQPLPLTISDSIRPVKCNGDADGQCSITTNGGTVPYKYLWSNGFTFQSPTNFLAGVYTVLVTDKYGCGITDTITITEPPVITLNVTSVPTTCPYDSGMGIAIASGGTGVLKYKWTPSGDTNATAQDLSGGTYTVTVTDSNGCLKKDTARIDIIGIPVDSVCCNASILVGDSVELNIIPGSAGSSYNWFPLNAISCANCPNPIVSPMVSTWYYVQITNDKGCRAEDSVFINVDEDCEVFVPNAFSPNGDGQNDILLVKGQCIQSLDFMIYDRWGNKVFESENQSLGWDGTYKGEPMNTETYIYLLHAILYNGKTIFKKGNIALIR